MVVRNTVMSGRASGMWTAIGIALGVSVWVVAASVGMAALLAASAIAFAIVKFAGAAYLIYLGLRSIRAAIKERRAPAAELQLDRGMSRWEAFRSGLLGNVLNPKAVVFFPALMPQFIGTGAEWTHIGGFAAVAMTICAVWFLLLANLIGLFRTMLDRPRVRAWVSGVTGGILVALGVRVAAS
jgi:threonine/homoserine/homoserine lactone efflux protein